MDINLLDYKQIFTETSLVHVTDIKQLQVKYIINL